MGTLGQRQVLIALAAAALSACAGMTTTPTPPGPERDARATVSALVDRYETPTSERFFDLVDSHRFPNYDTFFNNVREFQINNHGIMLDIIIDGIDVNEPMAGVRAHWNKSFVDPKGMNKLQSGTCELMLRRRQSGGYLLTSIQGDSPF
jgi:hypothetical protein